MPDEGLIADIMRHGYNIENIQKTQEEYFIAWKTTWEPSTVKEGEHTMKVKWLRFKIEQTYP